MRFRGLGASASFGSTPWAEASGAARVVYFYGGEFIPLYALLVYAKSAKTDLSPAERRAVAGLATAIRAAAKEKQ